MHNINLILNQASLRMPNYKDVNIQSFSIEPALYNSIYIGNCLSYIEYDAACKLIHQAISKLVIGGTLIVQNYDIVSVSQEIADGKVDMKVASQLLGNKSSYHSIFSILELVEKDRSIQISKKDVENLNFMLELLKV